MKKIVSLVLITLLALTMFASCSGKSNTSSTADPSSSPSSTATAAELYEAALKKITDATSGIKSEITTTIKMDLGSDLGTSEVTTTGYTITKGNNSYIELSSEAEGETIVQKYTIVDNVLYSCMTAGGSDLKTKTPADQSTLENLEDLVGNTTFPLNNDMLKDAELKKNAQGNNYFEMNVPASAISEFFKDFPAEELSDANFRSFVITVTFDADNNIAECAVTAELTVTEDSYTVSAQLSATVKYTYNVTDEITAPSDAADYIEM